LSAANNPQKNVPGAKNNTMSSACVASTVLPALLKLSAKISDKDFTDVVAPHLLQWIALKDRNVRIAMLEGASYYVERVPESVLAKSYYPNISAGFLDISPVLRDLTIRSMLVFVPKLPERTVNIDLMRAFARLQVDKESSIRINTTVCLGKLLNYLDKSTREKVIVPAFSRALKDAFPPARVAGLVAFGNSRGYVEPAVIARSIIPAISPMLIDPDSRVRTEASKLMKNLLEDIEKFASTLPETTTQVTPNAPATQKVASNPPQQQATQTARPATAPTATAQKSEKPAVSRPGKFVAEECDDTQVWDDFDDDFDEKPPSATATSSQTSVPVDGSKNTMSGWEDMLIDEGGDDDAPIFGDTNQASGWQADLDLGDSDAFFREMTTPTSAKPSVTKQSNSINQ